MDEIIELEHRLADRDDPSLGDLLDNAFIEVGRTGRILRRDDVAAALAAPPAGPVSIVSPAVRPLGEDVALCVYETRGPGGRTFWSSIWQRQPDGWRLVFHQGTPAADEPG